MTMKSRLDTFIASCRDIKVTEVKYHRKCWGKYVSYRSTEENDNSVETNVNVNSLFYDHVKTVIFDENEPRTLKGLLEDYNKLLTDNMCPVCQKTSVVKELLENEFGERIGFHSRSEVNQSWIVYDVSKGGSYIEAALKSWGIPSDDLLFNVAKRLKNDLKSVDKFKWPPKSSALETPTKVPESILKFMTWLRNPTTNATVNEDDPKILGLSDLLYGFITNERTQFKVLLLVGY